MILKKIDVTVDSSFQEQSVEVRRQSHPYTWYQVRAVAATASNLW